MNKDWKIFFDSLLESIRKIDENYFLVERFKDIPVYRERAYCYELYHQLRSLLPKEFPYTLHGELDKRGHHIMKEKLGKDRIPDFILHRPNSEDNLVVIEVKPSDCSEEEALDDIDKLKKFINNADYKYGIFLRFGKNLKASVISNDARIILIHHKESRCEPIVTIC